MTKKEFINLIIDGVTVGGTLPLNVTSDRIGTLVKNAVATFREKDDRMTQEDILYITPSTSCKKILLPEDIKAVTRLEFCANGTISREFSGIIDEGRVFYTNGENDMLSYVTREAYYQMVKEMGVRWMPYDFSEYTHELLLEGEMVAKSIFAEVARYIPEEAVYDIDDFRRYCEAMLSLEWAKLNKFLKIKLPQGREIDWDVIKEDAKETVDGIKEYWDGQDWGFIMTD